MRRLLLLWCALLPTLALGQGLSTRAPGQTGQKRTNLLKQSNSASTSTSVVTPWTLGSATVATIDAAPAYAGGGTWVSVTNTNAYSVLTQAVTIPSSASFILSAWTRKESGTGKASVVTTCKAQTPTVCSCLRSDGGTCTAKVVAVNYCSATVTDLGTTPVRLTSIVTCTAALTATDAILGGGDWGTDTGTSSYTGAMLEVGVTKPSQICVTTTVARTCK